MGIDWRILGLVLAGEFVFACGVAWLTRYFTTVRLQGQTYWLVVLGVSGVVAIAEPVIGWESVFMLALAFSVAALPMGLEYFSRVATESKAAFRDQLEMLGGDDEDAV